MADQPTEPPEHHQQSKIGQIVKAITSAGIGISLVCLFGLTLVGAVILLIIATPVLVLCSPVLAPAAIVTFLVTAALFFSGGCGVAAMTVFSWGYNYFKGKHPMGADTLDKTMEGIANKAKQMTNKAKMYGQHGQYVQMGLL